MTSPMSSPQPSDSESVHEEEDRASRTTSPTPEAQPPSPSEQEKRSGLRTLEKMAELGLDTSLQYELRKDLGDDDSGAIQQHPGSPALMTPASFLAPASMPYPAAGYGGFYCVPDAGAIQANAMPGPRQVHPGDGVPTLQTLTPTGTGMQQFSFTAPPSMPGASEAPAAPPSGSGSHGSLTPTSTVSPQLPSVSVNGAVGQPTQMGAFAQQPQVTYMYMPCTAQWPTMAAMPGPIPQSYLMAF